MLETVNMCPNCGGSDISVFTCTSTVEFRGLVLDVEKLQKTTCRDCKHVFESDSQYYENQKLIRAAYSVERDRLRQKDGLLSGAEIEQIRTAFLLNQREAAVIFGGGFNAFNKYESGEVLQSFAMDRLLRLAAVVGRPAIDFLRDVKKSPEFKVVPFNTKAVDKTVVFFIGINKEALQSDRRANSYFGSGTSNTCMPPPVYAEAAF